jgi:hypothetical protein
LLLALSGTNPSEAKPEGKAAIGKSVELVTGGANSGTDERRQTPPRTEVEIGIRHDHPGGMVRVVMVETELVGAEACRRTEIRVAEILADDLEIRSLAALTGDIEPELVVPGVADAETDKVSISHVVLNDLPASRPDKVLIELMVL